MAFVRLLAVATALAIVLAESGPVEATDPECEGAGSWSYVVETWGCGPARAEYCESIAPSYYKNNCTICASSCWYASEGCDDDVCYECYSLYYENSCEPDEGR